MDWTLIGVTAIGIIVTVIGGLLGWWNSSQQKSIERVEKMVKEVELNCKADSSRLWEEHAKDVQRLNDAEVKIAGNPNREEMTAAIARMLQHIDSRFEDMKGYINDRRHTER